MSKCDPCSVGGCEYIFCCVVCDVGYSVGACVSDLLCGKWLLVDRYVHHLLCGA